MSLHLDGRTKNRRRGPGNTRWKAILGAVLPRRCGHGGRDARAEMVRRQGIGSTPSRTMRPMPWACGLLGSRRGLADVVAFRKLHLDELDGDAVEGGWRCGAFWRAGCRSRPPEEPGRQGIAAELGLQGLQEATSSRGERCSLACGPGCGPAQRGAGPAFAYMLGERLPVIRARAEGQG